MTYGVAAFPFLGSRPRVFSHPREPSHSSAITEPPLNITPKWPDMKMQFNFHRKTGLKPGFSLSLHDYGVGKSLCLRVWWSAATLTWVSPCRAD